MARYNNDYRVMHYNGTVNDAISTIDEHTYNLHRATKKHFKDYSVKFHGNGVVKTVIIENNYPLYQTTVAEYKANK